MAAFANGIGGTIPGVTVVEDFTMAILNFLRIQQGNKDRNPNSLKYLVINQNTEGSVSGTFTCPVLVSEGTDGAVVITAPSYLTGVTYVRSEGGDSKAINEVQALIDAVRRQKALELDETKNPNNGNHLSWGVIMGTTGVLGTNGTITLTFSGLPVDITQTTNGSINIEGRTYLL
jgi:hypothetical protein